MTFFNSIGVGGDVRRVYDGDCSSQEEVILVWFSLNPNSGYTPFEVKKFLSVLEGVPITSVRRAICCLENKGYLVKEGQRVGEYGKLNYCWKLKRLE